MMSLGILLIHGYTGSPADFGTLPDELRNACPGSRVLVPALPGHDEPGPEFSLERFLDTICETAATLSTTNSTLILVGHSTGGVLALTAVAERGLKPRLLVIAAAPNRIDGNYPARWEAHSRLTGNSSGRITFTSIAQMVDLINRNGRRPAPVSPMLLVQGDADELVPPSEITRWESHLRPRSFRSILVPGARHHMFKGPGSAFACDAIVRAVRDVNSLLSETDQRAITKLAQDEPAISGFLSRSPVSAHHLVCSPSGLGPDFTPSLEPAGEPVFANIEITTRCNLRCVFCARTSGARPVEDMPLDTFTRILNLLPHAYRITLVGLGEPLLHPKVVAFVALAAAQGRRVSLVTNALALTPELSQRLLAAGLHGITFSLDAPTQELAAQVRAGTDLARALINIEHFSALAKASHGSSDATARAVFSAVSTTTLPFLEDLVRTVARLDVDALMLSDLNFKTNLAQSLWKNQTPALAATVRKAVHTAFSLRLPLLSVRGLEAFAMSSRYEQHLLIPPDQLYTRSVRRRHCASPWQTLPIGVRGTLTLCDCQPDKAVGNLLEQPFKDLWHSDALREHRRSMLSEAPPEACLICPRF